MSGVRPAADCVFCRIVAGTERARVVRVWPQALAVVPVRPVIAGHLLVLSRRHVTDAGADPDTAATTMRAAAELAAGMDACNVITSRGPAATQTVPHLHLHVVPRHEGDRLLLPWSHPGR
ncbi:MULTISPECIES: HIT family protein [Streptomyces]|uniref:HIT family protein n=2 Tax=Streptomyces TaxID=1883 RepID=A0ABV9IKH6_9ACTN